MNSYSTNSLKKFANRAVFFGVIAAAIAFVIALYQPREYLIVGKIVVFPTSSATSQKNLGYEVGNTVQILNGAKFKSDTLRGLASNFAYAKQLDNSSTVAFAMYAPKAQQVAVEDTISRIPNALSDYTRDLYDGSPFKYRLLSDPEISAGPVKPNLTQFIATGFVMGIILYLIYWILFELLRVPRETTDEYEEEVMPVSNEQAEDEVISENIVEKVTDDSPKPATIGSGTIEIIDGRPKFKPGKVDNATSGAPDNLPVTSVENPPAPQSEEPTDEEVKERLNRLMRGEL